MTTVLNACAGAIGLIGAAVAAEHTAHIVYEYTQRDAFYVDARDAGTENAPHIDVVLTNVGSSSARVEGVRMLHDDRFPTARGESPVEVSKPPSLQWPTTLAPGASLTIGSISPDNTGGTWQALASVRRNLTAEVDFSRGLVFCRRNVEHVPVRVR